MLHPIVHFVFCKLSYLLDYIVVNSHQYLSLLIGLLSSYHTKLNIKKEGKEFKMAEEVKGMRKRVTRSISTGVADDTTKNKYHNGNGNSNGKPYRPKEKEIPFYGIKT